MQTNNQEIKTDEVVTAVKSLFYCLSILIALANRMIIIIYCKIEISFMIKRAVKSYGPFEPKRYGKMDTGS